MNELIGDTKKIMMMTYLVYKDYKIKKLTENDETGTEIGIQTEIRKTKC